MLTMAAMTVHTSAAYVERPTSQHYYLNLKKKIFAHHKKLSFKQKLFLNLALSNCLVNKENIGTLVKWLSELLPVQ